MTRIVIGCFLVCLLLGCSKGGVDRYALSGKVTYKGEPVPFGRIVFTPDLSRGNDGPQGIARIVDGQYHTDKTGKGAVTGSLIVQIDGYTAMPSSNEGGDAKPLFQNWTTSIELAPEQSTFDFEIP
jgi:hypothetical protein